MTLTNFVPETSFGVWFLRTRVWELHVLRVAITDLARLAGSTIKSNGGTWLDIGCGQGKSLPLLAKEFRPDALIGLDCHGDSLDLARQATDGCDLPVRLLEATCSSIPLCDDSVDVIFCHQTFHHLVDQETALEEFLRVLKPGGALLFAESTKAYIDTWVIRWLFRHPMEVQKSADEYLHLLRERGFVIDPAQVSYPYLWWSRSRDFGLLERLRLRSPLPHGRREETLLNVVARKPSR